MDIIDIKTIKIKASQGKIYTDGIDYGVIMFLGANKNKDDFYEITIEEYKKILEEKRKEEESEL